LKQEKVAAISDVMGRIAMKPDDPFEIDTKPHGHGDIHTLLCSSGMAESWRTRGEIIVEVVTTYWVTIVIRASSGKEFIVFLQDTNPLAFTAAVSALGVSADHCLEVFLVLFENRLCAGGYAMLVLHYFSD
jgi:UDP-sugar pyrophosphorylase